MVLSIHISIAAVRHRLSKQLASRQTHRGEDIRASSNVIPIAYRLVPVQSASIAPWSTSINCLTEHHTLWSTLQYGNTLLCLQMGQHPSLYTCLLQICLLPTS